MKIKKPASGPGSGRNAAAPQGNPSFSTQIKEYRRQPEAMSASAASRADGQEVTLSVTSATHAQKWVEKPRRHLWRGARCGCWQGRGGGPRRGRGTRTLGRRAYSAPSSTRCGGSIINPVPRMQKLRQHRFKCTVMLQSRGSLAPGLLQEGHGKAQSLYGSCSSPKPLAGRGIQLGTDTQSGPWGLMDLSP